LEKLLTYQETPQYLRKALFKQDPDLHFSVILPPLRIPSHPNVGEPRIGEIREALVIESGAHSIVNAGFRAAVEISSRLKLLERVTIRVVQITPQLKGELVKPTRLPIYCFFCPDCFYSLIRDHIQVEVDDLTEISSFLGENLRDSF